MDDHSNSPLFSPFSPLFFAPSTTATTNWAYHSHGKVAEEGEEESVAETELQQALLYATLELESTRAAAQEELVRMEGEAARLRALVEAATRERDEARQQCHHALFLLHTAHQQQQQQQQHHSNNTQQPLPINNTNQEAQFASPPPPGDMGISITAAPAKTTASASSEESSVMSSPPPPPPPPLPKASDSKFDIGTLAANRDLPEKGRLLEAVMKAGPLLQNLLLAGPLPQWRHPPPPLRTFEIPPVAISTTTTTAATEAIPGLNRDEGSRKRKDREGEMESAGFSSPSSSWSPPPPHPLPTHLLPNNSSSSGKYQWTSGGSLLQQVEYH